MNQNSVCASREATAIMRLRDQGVIVSLESHVHSFTSSSQKNVLSSSESLSGGSLSRSWKIGPISDDGLAGARDCVAILIATFIDKALATFRSHYPSDT